MNAVSGTDQPAEGTVSSSHASRRTFLKGAGLAGAAGLAAPLLARTSARAATTGIILGVNSPEPWTPPTYPATTPQPWQSLVQSVPGRQSPVGSRAYRDTPFSAGPDMDPNCPTAFPGENGYKPVKPVASVRPDPTVLLNPNDYRHNSLVAGLNAIILDGMTKASNGTFAGTPQLTVWHEAGSFYGDTYSQYGVVRGTQTTINGTRLDAAQIVRSTHVKMQELCNQQATTYYWLPRVEYGCIIYGDIDKMASDTDPTQNYVPGIPPFPPNTRYPMDWYGIDVYYEDDTQWGSTTNTHGNLDSDGAISNYMGPFATMARSRGGSGARINVTECNASLANEGSRPWFFEHLAKWLYNNGGYRMLTFFTDTPPAHHSVTWEHVADASPAYTIDALNSIVATYG